VVLAEREVGPRYHIGESLLPSCLRIFDLLGVREKVEAHGFQRKDGAFFEWAGEEWDFAFGTDANPLYGFQVVRSEFDRLLLDHAAAEGVEVLEGTTAKEIRFENGRPRSALLAGREGGTLEVAFDFIVDASGRTGLLASRYFGTRRFHEVFRNVAVWGYWRGAKRLPVGPFGAIATCSVPYGWVWAIPLHTGLLSVGLVMHKSRLRELKSEHDLEAIYARGIAASPAVSSLIEDAARATSLRAETDYSYAADRFAGPGHFLVGDAACFLDPLLSTGVHLATFSGLVAAASVGSALRGEISEDTAIEFFNSTYRSAYLRMLVVVSVFYQTNRNRDGVFHKAQQLSRSDYSDGELMDAFVHIVAGLEDFRDIGHGRSQALLESLTRLYEEHYAFMRDRGNWRALTAAEIEQGLERSRIVGAIQEEFALTPETATNGLYVAADPHLRVEQVVV
jgi:flavin-dependent dehydrogenase